jgi:hypothetical protein
MRETIIGSAIRHLGPIQFDVTSKLDISNEEDGTKPLIFYLISHLVDLPNHTATVSQKINNIICNYFQYIQIAKKLRPFNSTLR